MKSNSIRIAAMMLLGVALPLAAANQPPQLTANNTLLLDQGASAVVTADLLAATDAESPPSQVTFTVAPTLESGPPRNGQLRLNGANLAAGSTFTQDDINNGRLVYFHDDSDTTDDDFQFDVSDPDGGNIPGAPYFAYTFHIVINLINHAPVAGHGSGSTGYGVPFAGILPATDRDVPAQPLNYSIVTNGLKGTAVITDTNTGAFVYTPNPGERGPDIISFQVSDGLLDSVNPGTFTITMKPLAISANYPVLESSACLGTLSATNAIAPHMLTYRLLTNATKGALVITDTNTGAFTFTPMPGVVGLDRFTFAVNDGFLDSEPATCTLTIQPIVEPGDIFFTEMMNQLLIYLDRKTLVASVIAAGGNLRGPKGCTIDHNGNVLVIGGGGGVVRIHPADGTQSVVSPGTNFSSANMGAFGIAEEPDGSILVADGPNGLVRVAPGTGAVTPLAQGGNLLLTLGVAVAATGDIYVTDATGAANTNLPSCVVRIDPVSGAQTVISAGTNLTLPVGIALESPDSLVVSDAGGFLGGQNRVLRINIGTGAQSIVSEGGHLAIPVGLGIDDLGNIAVASQGLAEVVQVDPVTGDQSVIASGPSSLIFLGLTVARGAKLPDSDDDGLPDWWEQRYFAYTNAAPEEDQDQDGFNNRAEFRAGTDPTNAQSSLKLELNPAPGGGLLLEWNSVLNRFYSLERASALTNAPAAFAPVCTGIKATPPRNSMPEPEPGLDRQYFYRLRLEE